MGSTFAGDFEADDLIVLICDCVVRKLTENTAVIVEPKPHCHHVGLQHLTLASRAVVKGRATVELDEAQARWWAIKKL